MAAANNLHAILTPPTQAQSWITVVIVKPPAVNCQWPQDSFESSSLISLEFGSTASMRLRNEATLSDGVEDLKSGEAAMASRRAIACGIGGCFCKNSSRMRNHPIRRFNKQRRENMLTTKGSN